jgi:uncharacterized membrane protein YbaN (DUF454 family)
MATHPAQVRPTAVWLRPLYLILGLVSLGIGVVGIFLPLIPTTGPLLLAAFFFARSSERLHAWLVGHPRFGRFVSDFQNDRSIPLKAKIVALVAMTAAFTYAIGWVATHPMARVTMIAVAAWAIWFVARLPLSRPPTTAEHGPQTP